MATLLNCGALFIHIPKTGGNWVSDVLEEEGLVLAHVSGKHASDQLADFESFFRQPYAYSKPNRALYKFCFVRHPLRWYESWFRMQQAQGWPMRGDASGPGGLLPFWNPTAELDRLGGDDFNVFVGNVLRQQPGFVTAMYRRYARGVHFVGRQETLVDDLISVLRKLGVSFNEARIRAHAPVNVSKPLPVAWNPILEAEALRLEQGALAWYGPEAVRTPSIRFQPPYKKVGEYAYAFPLPQLAAMSDIDNDLFRSLLIVHENGILLRKPHAPHSEVAAGRGAYSHWKDAVLFSASDNTDPNTNGKEYTAEYGLGADAFSMRIQP